MMKFWIQVVLLVCLQLFSAFALALGNDSTNIMIVLVDDLGFSDLGCYGGEIETPNAKW